MIEYHAAFYGPKREGEKVFVKLFDFPGVASQGEDLAEAREMIADALELMTEHYVESGKPLPIPNPASADTEADLVETPHMRE